MNNDYTILSNQENGAGRADIILKKKKTILPNVVIEFKYINKDNTTDHDLAKLAIEGINQIKEKNYTAELQGKTICIGLAHHGKYAYMQYEEMDVG